MALAVRNAAPHLLRRVLALAFLAFPVAGVGGDDVYAALAKRLGAPVVEPLAIDGVHYGVSSAGRVVSVSFDVRRGSRQGGSLTGLSISLDGKRWHDCLGSYDAASGRVATCPLNPAPRAESVREIRLAAAG